MFNNISRIAQIVVTIDFKERKTGSRADYIKDRVKYYNSLCKCSIEDVILEGVFYRKDLEILDKELDLHLNGKILYSIGNYPISFSIHSFIKHRS